MLEVAANPSKYLPLDSLSFLKRYVAGGVFLAHADWLPLRCVTVAKLDASQSDDWIAGELIRKYIALSSEMIPLRTQ